jgi:hypothetical protein
LILPPQNSPSSPKLFCYCLLLFYQPFAELHTTFSHEFAQLTSYSMRPPVPLLLPCCPLSAVALSTNDDMYMTFATHVFNTYKRTHNVHVDTLWSIVLCLRWLLVTRTELQHTIPYHPVPPSFILSSAPSPP